MISTLFEEPKLVEVELTINDSCEVVSETLIYENRLFQTILYPASLIKILRYYQPKNIPVTIRLSEY